MLQTESRVKIVDNTWAKTWLIIGLIKWNASFATVWDKVVIAVKSALPSSTYNKWDVVRAVIVRVAKEIRRKDGSYIRFEDNAVAIIDKEWAAKWKRIFGPVAKELREKGFKNIANMAEEII